MDQRRYIIGKTAYAPGAFHAGYYAVNPKTGAPWQRYRPILAGADVRQYTEDRPRYFSTHALALKAVQNEATRSHKGGSIQGAAPTE